MGNQCRLTGIELNVAVLRRDPRRTSRNRYDTARGQLQGVTRRLVESNQPELVASDQFLHARRLHWYRHDAIDRSTLKVDHLKSLLDMQRTSVAGCIESIPIVQAKGAVASLLDLGHNKPGTQRMDSTGWNKNAISRIW